MTHFATTRRRLIAHAPAAIAAAATAGSVLAGTAAQAATDMAPQWRSGWGRTLVAFGQGETIEAGGTYTETVPTSLAGQAIRLVLSNELSTEPLHLSQVLVSANGAVRRTTFGNLQGIAIPPGAKAITDPVLLPVNAGTGVQVTLHLGRTCTITAQERRAQPAGAWLSAYGSANAREIAPMVLSAVDVSGSADAPVLVVLSDTKSAGPETWTSMLARLAAGRIGVVNRSLYAGHLALGPAGASALARFDRDVLATTGATHVLVFTGNNDLIQPGMINSRGQPTLDPALAMSAPELIALLRQCVDRTRAAGLLAVGGTWLPYEGVTIAQGYSSPEKLAKRDAVNAWIRSPGAFDLVIDFDAALRAPANLQQLDPAFDEGNRFTPNQAGYERMARTALSAFGLS